MKVRCRMAPSPSGKLHLGTAHTSLFNFAFAKHNGGDFILRIDNTDSARAKEEFEQDIIESLKWLGITWDEGPDIGGPYAPYRQSERFDIYKKYVEKLLASGHAYRCFCGKEELDEKRKAAEESHVAYKYDGKCRNLTPEEIEEKIKANIPFTVRFLNPNKVVAFKDQIRGEIKVDSTAFGDFIIVRSNGDPLLNLAVVVDDIEMKITHVIRGEDFLSASPYQVLLYEALGEAMPEIANFSFIFASDRTKLSKRHGATSISDFRDLGYLKEALINYLIFLNWNPGDDRTIMSLEEFIKEFDFKRVLKSTPAFDQVKLNWYNQQYIKVMDDTELAKRIQPFTKRSEEEIVRVLPLIKDRLVTLVEFDELTDFFFSEPTIEKESLAIPNSKKVIEHAISTLEASWDGKKLEEAARAFCAQENIKVGDYFMVLRIAMTGRKATPPLWDVMELVGKDQTLERLKASISLAS